MFRLEKTRVIRSFRVKKSRLPPTLHSLLLHTLLQTLPFLRFINSIKPVLGSLVVMGRSVWVAVVTDNFYHTFREKSCSVKRRKFPCTAKADLLWPIFIIGIHIPALSFSRQHTDFIQMTSFVIIRRNGSDEYASSHKNRKIQCWWSERLAEAQIKQESSMYPIITSKMGNPNWDTSVAYELELSKV